MNAKQIKSLFYVIAVIVMTIIIAISCKKKPTDAGNFSVIEEAPGESGETPQPEKKLPIDTNQGLIQFKGLSFKSGGYILNGDRSRIIYYYADVKVDSDSKPYISAITKDADGNIVEDEGKFYNISNETGAVYNLEGVRYKGNNINTAVATFIEDGYLIIKFSNYGMEIKYSLIGKSSDKIVEGTFVSGEFTATIKDSQITIGYKDWYGGQGPLVIKTEGKTPIKAKNSRVGFNFIIGGINGTRYLVTDATPNYDADGNLSSIAFTSKHDGQKFTVEF